MLSQKWCPPFLHQFYAKIEVLAVIAALVPNTLRLVLIRLHLHYRNSSIRTSLAVTEEINKYLF